MNYVTVIAGILQEVLGIASSVTSGQVQNVIGILDRVIPVAVSTEQALLPSIQNIIAALNSNGAVTADQVAALQTQSDAVDAALDAAAATDGLT